MVSFVTPERLRERTKRFALDALRLVRSLPKTDEARMVGNQLLRSATSIAANYRAAGRARSRSEFVSKLGIAVEEADETLLWLEILLEAGIVTEERARALIAEANELLRILVASRRTARSAAKPPAG